MIAKYLYYTGATGLFISFFVGLSACSGLHPAARPVVFDFGPGETQPAAIERRAPLPTLVLGDVDAGEALDSTAVLYRLAYSDSAQLRPYVQTRWSMPPAQLVRQRAREMLGRQRNVLQSQEGVLPPDDSLSLRLTLEEFSQIFETPTQSSGLIRLRATLSQTGPNLRVPGRLLAQQSFVVRRPAPTADAAGGVSALTLATDGVLGELEQWLKHNQSAPAPVPAIAN